MFCCTRISCIFNEIHNQELMSSILLFCWIASFRVREMPLSFSEIILYFGAEGGWSSKEKKDSESELPTTVREICGDPFNFLIRTRILNTFYVILFLNHHLSRSLKLFLGSRAGLIHQCQSFYASFWLQGSLRLSGFPPLLGTCEDCL